jgi:uncharacterized protein
VLNFSRGLQLEYKDAKVVVQIVLPGHVRTEFFGASGGSPFPDHLFMTADELATTALAGLDQAELICFPNLPDTAGWAALKA